MSIENQTNAEGTGLGEPTFEEAVEILKTSQPELGDFEIVSISPSRITDTPYYLVNIRAGEGEEAFLVDFDSGEVRKWATVDR